MSPSGVQRSAREQPVALVGLILAFAVAIAAAVLLTRGHPAPRQHTAAVAAPAARSAVIGTRPAPPAVTPAQLAQARRVARRFLASYLPVLYGRVAARTVSDASPRVRAELSAAARTPRAPRDRRPRVTRLSTSVQNATTVVVIALVADTITRPYQVVMQLSRTPGGWQVTQLANY